MLIIKKLAVLCVIWVCSPLLQAVDRSRSEPGVMWTLGFEKHQYLKSLLRERFDKINVLQAEPRCMPEDAMLVIGNEIERVSTYFNLSSPQKGCFKYIVALSVPKEKLSLLERLSPTVFTQEAIPKIEDQLDLAFTLFKHERSHYFLLLDHAPSRTERALVDRFEQASGIRITIGQSDEEQVVVRTRLMVQKGIDLVIVGPSESLVTANNIRAFLIMLNRYKIPVLGGPDTRYTDSGFLGGSVPSHDSIDALVRAIKEVDGLKNGRVTVDSKPAVSLNKHVAKTFGVRR